VAVDLDDRVVHVEEREPATVAAVAGLAVGLAAGHVRQLDAVAARFLLAVAGLGSPLKQHCQPDRLGPELFT
jgi:hypothetical protein